MLIDSVRLPCPLTSFFVFNISVSLTLTHVMIIQPADREREWKKMYRLRWQSRKQNLDNFDWAKWSRRFRHEIICQWFREAVQLMSTFFGRCSDNDEFTLWIGSVTYRLRTFRLTIRTLVMIIATRTAIDSMWMQEKTIQKPFTFFFFLQIKRDWIEPWAQCNGRMRFFKSKM